MDTINLLIANWEAVLAAVITCLTIYRLLCGNEATKKSLAGVLGVLETLRDDKTKTAKDVIDIVAADHAILRLSDPLAARALSDAVRVADPKKQPRNFWGHFSDIVIGPSIKTFIGSKLGDND